MRNFNAENYVKENLTTIIEEWKEWKKETLNKKTLDKILTNHMDFMNFYKDSEGYDFEVYTVNTKVKGLDTGETFEECLEEENMNDR